MPVPCHMQALSGGGARGEGRAVSALPFASGTVKERTSSSATTGTADVARTWTSHSGKTPVKPFSSRSNVRTTCRRARVLKARMLMAREDTGTVKLQWLRIACRSRVVHANRLHGSASACA